jgi:toxin YoeB
MPQRNITFTPKGWEDYQYWFNQDQKSIKKINALIKETLREPFEGTGMPEPLKENYAGYWSRRINKKDRLVYSVTDNQITVIACRFHYNA